MFWGSFKIEVIDVGGENTLRVSITVLCTGVLNCMKRRKQEKYPHSFVFASWLWIQCHQLPHTAAHHAFLPCQTATSNCEPKQTLPVHQFCLEFIPETEEVTNKENVLPWVMLRGPRWIFIPPQSCLSWRQGMVDQKFPLGGLAKLVRSKVAAGLCQSLTSLSGNI